MMNFEEFLEETGNKHNKELSFSESIGGTRGGSCWGSENLSGFTRVEGYDDCRRYMNEAISNIFEKICPNITYLQYRKFENLFENSTKTEYEYYGNSTDYFTLKLDLERMYNLMIELELIK